MAHARLGPSNHRWPHCPGSVREEAFYPDTSGAAAIDGTGSHLLLELCLLSQDGYNSNASDWIGRTIGEGDEDKPSGWTVDSDRAARVQMCLSYIKRRVSELSAQHQQADITVTAEQKADPGGMFGRTDWWGTCDVTITVTTGSILLFCEVVDYKDGRGWVSETNNSQLISYLGGQMRPYIASGPQKVRPFRVAGVQCRMTIVQPKTNPPVRYQDLNAGAVVMILEELATAAQKTDDPNAPLIADDRGGKGHCQWCKHKKNCSARAAIGAQGVMTMTNMATTSGSLLENIQSGQIAVSDMTNDQLSEALDAAAAIRSLMEGVEAEATRRSEETPGSISGYEMGTGRASRVWADDPETVEKKLKGMRLKKDQIYPAKLATPAQIEKIDTLTDRQKKKLSEEMITSMAGKPKLVKSKRTDDKKGVDMFAEQIAPAQEPQPAVEPAAAQQVAAAVPSFL